MPYSINLQNKRVKYFIVSSTKEFPIEIEIQIYSNSNEIGITFEDDIILFDNFYSYKSYFSYYGYVIGFQKIIVEDQLKIELGKNRFDLKIIIENEVTEDNNLEFLEYSLYKIYRFGRPWVHFPTAYSYLTDTDYNTIINKNFFVSRTAFGKFINSLHKEHRINFIEYFIDNEPEIYFGKKDFVRAWELLKEYIINHILKPVQYLEESYDIIQELTLESASSIGFMDSGEKPQLIKKQLDYMRESENIYETDILQNFSEDILNEIQIGISEHSNKERFFNHYFKDKPWPIEI